MSVPTETELKLHELATKALALQGNGEQPALIGDVGALLSEVLQLVPDAQYDYAMDCLGEALSSVNDIVNNAALIAGVAQELVQDAMKQRDVAIRTLARLEEALEDPYGADDSRIEALIEGIEEEAYASVEDMVYEDAYNTGFDAGRGAADGRLQDEWGEGFDAGYMQAKEDLGLE